MFALAFALRGTLTVAEHLERDAFVELLRERSAATGAPYREPDAVAAANAVFPPGDRDVVSPSDLAAAATAFAGDAVAGAALIARFRQIADRLAPSRVVPSPHARETLKRMASLGIPMAVLCNGWSRIARREADCAGFTGSVIASEDIGVAKPGRRAFDTLADVLGLPAACIWYVGNDARTDVDGAVKAGLKAVWLNPDNAAYPAGLEPPALTIRSLDELLPPVCEEYTRSLLSLRHLMRTALEWRDGHYVPAPENPL